MIETQKKSAGFNRKTLSIQHRLFIRLCLKNGFRLESANVLYCPIEIGLLWTFVLGSYSATLAVEFVSYFVSYFVLPQFYIWKATLIGISNCKCWHAHEESEGQTSFTCHVLSVKFGLLTLGIERFGCGCGSVAVGVRSLGAPRIEIVF